MRQSEATVPIERDFWGKRQVLSADQLMHQVLEWFVRQPRPEGEAWRGVTDGSASSQWNATSHADPHSHGCPSAPAMQHPGGADVTVALHR